jgi:hypothetical protein
MAGKMSIMHCFHGAYLLITTSCQLCGSLVTRRCEEEGFGVPPGDRPIMSKPCHSAELAPQRFQDFWDD